MLNSYTYTNRYIKISYANILADRSVTFAYLQRVMAEIFAGIVVAVRLFRKIKSNSIL